MEFGSALKVLLRRWPIVLVGALLTLSAAGYVVTRTPPTYRATANLLLLLPTNAIDGTARTSPFLNLPSELGVLARMVSAPISGQSYADELERLGLTSPYEVGVDPRSPIITVGVEGTDRDDVLATRDHIVETIQHDLATVQSEEDVPSRQIARTRVFAAEEVSEELGGSAFRGAMGVVAAGGLLTLLVSFGIDGLALARRRRAEGQVATDDAEAEAEQASAPGDAEQTSSTPRK